MIDAFCDERLDDEYAEICRYVAGNLHETVIARF